MKNSINFYYLQQLANSMRDSMRDLESATITCNGFAFKPAQPRRTSKGSK